MFEEYASGPTKGKLLLLPSSFFRNISTYVSAYMTWLHKWMKTAEGKGLVLQQKINLHHGAHSSERGRQVDRGN